MVAVPLIFGRLTTEDYSDKVAADPRIDALREKVRLLDMSLMIVIEVLTLSRLDGVC